MTIEVPDSIGQEYTFLCLTIEYELGETSFNETVAISALWEILGGHVVLIV